MFVVCINCSLFVNAVEIFTGPNDNKIPASTMIIVADILKKIQTQISDRFVGIDTATIATVTASKWKPAGCALSYHRFYSMVRSANDVPAVFLSAGSSSVFLPYFDCKARPIYFPL